MFKEWRFDHVEDLHQCNGVCPCGKKAIRYKHHIQNRFTKEMTHVGSKCIELFGRNMKIIRRVAETLLGDGFTGTCKMIKNKFAQFSVCGNSIIVKHESELKKYFNKFPITKKSGKCIVDVKLSCRSDRRKLKVGEKFKIWAQMKVKRNNNLELEIQDVDKKRNTRRPSAFGNVYIKK